VLRKIYFKHKTKIFPPKSLFFLLSLKPGDGPGSTAQWVLITSLLFPMGVSWAIRKHLKYSKQAAVSSGSFTNLLRQIQERFLGVATCIASVVKT